MLKEQDRWTASVSRNRLCADPNTNKRPASDFIREHQPGLNFNRWLPALRSGELLNLIIKNNYAK